MAARHDYHLARTIITTFFTNNRLETIASLTPTLLNALYDQLAWERRSPAEEARHKMNIIKWIRRNLSEWDVEKGQRFGVKGLINGSIAERAKGTGSAKPSAATACTDGGVADRTAWRGSAESSAATGSIGRRVRKRRQEGAGANSASSRTGGLMAGDDGSMTGGNIDVLMADAHDGARSETKPTMPPSPGATD